MKTEYKEGYYLGATGLLFQLDRVGWASSVALSGDAKYHKPFADYADHGPFTRFRSEPDVAREVIDQIANVWEFGPPADVAAWMDEVAKNFGVTA